MNKKLSELSKPVAYTDADELRFKHATSDMWPVPLGFGRDTPLYSQECVSALLARIAEFEAEEARRKLIRDTWENIPMWQPPKHTGRGA
ncbi:TPA: hypothetical protein SLG95_000785 [Serratia liquefaciens]|nr:hypothetical protein [Serratia liquefaciens]